MFFFSEEVVYHQTDIHAYILFSLHLLSQLLFASRFGSILFQLFLPASSRSMCATPHRCLTIHTLSYIFQDIFIAVLNRVHLVCVQRTSTTLGTSRKTLDPQLAFFFCGDVSFRLVVWNMFDWSSFYSVVLLGIVIPSD